MSAQSLLRDIANLLEKIQGDEANSKKFLSAAENLLRLANLENTDFRKSEVVVELKKWVTESTTKKGVSA